MITLTQVKQELDITNTKYDTLIQAIIDCVETSWELLTKKPWIEQEVREVFDETCNGTIFLTGENVTSIYFIAAGTTPALTITGAVGGAVQTVSVTETSMVLFDGSAGETELLFADYPTLSDLVTQINTVDNFAAEIYPGYETTLSKYLMETAGDFCESTGTIVSMLGEFVTGAKRSIKDGTITIPYGYSAPITVVYKCGYTDTTCPAWLSQILVRQTCHWYHQAIEKRWNVSSITLGDGGTIAYGEQKGNLLSDFVNAAKGNKRVII